jgi:hypothetical protein
MTRDFVGYGAEPPHPRWPGEARVAVNFVINFEEGSASLRAPAPMPAIAAISRPKACSNTVRGLAGGGSTASLPGSAFR